MAVKSFWKSLHCEVGIDVSTIVWLKTLIYLFIFKLSPIHLKAYESMVSVYWKQLLIKSLKRTLVAVMNITEIFKEISRIKLISLSVLCVKTAVKWLKTIGTLSPGRIWLNWHYSNTSKSCLCFALEANNSLLKNLCHKQTWGFIEQGGSREKTFWSCIM